MSSHQLSVEGNGDDQLILDGGVWSDGGTLQSLSGTTDQVRNSTGAQLIINAANTITSLSSPLVLDHDGDGLIASGAELFGSSTLLPDGSTALNGFEALAVTDGLKQGVNDDRQITSSDAIFSRLRLWQDRNRDAISQAEELSTLESHQITSLSLTYTTFSTADGSTRQLADVWFATTTPTATTTSTTSGSGDGDPITGNELGNTTLTSTEPAPVEGSQTSGLSTTSSEPAPLLTTVSPPPSEPLLPRLPPQIPQTRPARTCWPAPAPIPSIQPAERCSDGVLL